MAKRDDLLARALLDVSLKTDPQLGALRSLLSERASQYSRERSVNAANARGIQAATREATPNVRGAFDQALSSVSAQRAALGQQSDPQAFAYARRVGEERANALTDLSQRSVRAEEGRVYANSQARSKYLGDKDKIRGQLVDLLGQRGALTTQRLRELESDEDKAAAQRRQQDIQVRGQDITARGQDITSADRRAGQRAAAQRSAAGKSKVKWATPEQQSLARSSIESAMTQAKYLRDVSGKKSRADIIDTLIRGRPAVKRDSGVTLPAIKALDADYVRAAVNVLFDGSLSRGDVQRLHNRRLRIKSLGYRVRRPGQQPRPANTASALLQGGAAGAVG